MKKNIKWLIIFLLPTLALFVLVFVASLVRLVHTSFFDWTLGYDMEFSGFANYFQLFKTRDFLAAAKNTLIWVVLQSTVHVFIGLLVALILFKKQFYWKFIRTVYMFPNIICSAALGMLYLCILNPEFGGVNRLVRSLGFTDFAQNWFMDFRTAFLSVTMTWLPYAAVVTILILAEIAAIEESVIESAKIDGASDLKINLYIIIPMLRNVLATCVIMAATSMLQKMDVLYMTTQGGPGNHTLNMAYYIYRTALVDNNFGLANAAGTVMVLFGIVLVMILSRVFRIGTSNISG